MYFGEMDICQLCGSYDTIQTYFPIDKYFIHVCEKCSEKGSEAVKMEYVNKLRGEKGMQEIKLSDMEAYAIAEIIARISSYRPEMPLQYKMMLDSLEEIKATLDQNISYPNAVIRDAKPIGDMLDRILEYRNLAKEIIHDI